MTCLDLELDLGDYVDGTLDHRDIPRVDAHLRRCSSCRAVVDDLRAMRVATRSLDALTPPPYLWPRIAAAVEAERRRSLIRRLLSTGTISRMVGRARLVRQRDWQPAFAAAVLVAMLGGGIWVSWHSVAAGTRTSIPATRTTSDVVAAIDPGDDQMQ